MTKPTSTKNALAGRRDVADSTATTDSRATVRPKPNGPVCEDTFGKAFATPNEKRGFVSPEFLGLVRLRRFHIVYGGMGHTVRLAAWLYPCLQHPAHCFRVKAQTVVLKSRKGAPTMSASKGQTAPVSKAAPAIPTTTTEAINHALLAGFYLRRGNVAAARRKAVQLLKSLQALEVAHV